MNAEQPEDPQRRSLRERLENVQIRSAKASSWRETADPLRSLINREGYVPISAKLTGGDLDFLATAREDLLCLAELGIRLLDLHQPRDAGGITSDTANPILRCRSCMWRWPCPTFRAMSDAFSPGVAGAPAVPDLPGVPGAPGTPGTAGPPGVIAVPDGLSSGMSD
ncbi:collagen-like triple helix repeat-containing protein [Sphaerimonospora sp. CA-214678]|uniref:collagen-like triple helix repeat-containing protein n=1 Tax=Sphaerimonospora sp. CA-214678 TaxID=3240029 RepID=UPI003D8F25BB